MGQLSSSPDLTVAETADPLAEICPGPPIAAQHWRLRVPLTFIPLGIGAGVLLLVMWLVPDPAMDEDRLWLLRGIVAAKALVALGAARLLYWRLSRPIKLGVAIGYSLCLSVSAAALGWLWGVQWFWTSSLVFWLGLFALLLVARKDAMFAEI